MDSAESTLKQTLDKLSHLDLTFDILKEVSDPIGGGGFSDVFYSKMHPGWRARTDSHIEKLLDETRSFSDPDCVMVAVKRLRFWGKTVAKVEKAIAKELTIWSCLSHSNVLPILGYVRSWTGSIYPSFISPWIENGTLRDYMKENNVDVPKISLGIISGLQYLHSQQVVHADLKCDNVLLSPTLRPLLTDFGLSRQIIASASASTTASGGSLRWKAPELLNGVADRASQQTDVWALGMTILELLTKDVPYNDMSDYQVILSITKGDLPPTPSNIGQRSVAEQPLWDLCQVCWAVDPSKRPDVAEVQKQLVPLYPESTKIQITEFLDLYPHLNLTHVAKLSQGNRIFSTPSSHFSSWPYSQSGRNTAFNFWGEINSQYVSETSSGSVEVRTRGLQVRSWSGILQPEPRVIAREIALIGELSHPNVLPFLGYILQSDEEILGAFPYIADEMSLYVYMHRNSVNVLLMAEGIASGLAYLHSNNVVCSILRSLEIWLSPSLQPLIEVSNLWLSRPDSAVPLKERQEIFQDNCRWMAVELFDNLCIGYTSKESDVWGFGMTVLELFTEDWPYKSFTRDVVIKNLKDHRPPSPPDDISNRSRAEQRLWALVQECWNFEPSERPTAQHLHERIKGIMKV